MGLVAFGFGQPMQDTIEFPRFDTALMERAIEVVQLAKECGCTIVTAESCTGGLLAAVLAEAPGAGKQLQGGFVTYTKDQKTIALGVPRVLLDSETAVSEAAARSMAEGALSYSIADVAVSITGVAGPEPDEDGNPVGLVHIAAARRAGPDNASEISFRRNEPDRHSLSDHVGKPRPACALHCRTRPCCRNGMTLGTSCHSAN